MDPHDVEVRYLDGPTSSQTVNLLALPFLLVWHRARGVRLLHIHWVHPFLLAWARGDRTRGAVQRGFELFLALADALGYRIVWTAHNLLPHVPVFRDDVAARRALLAHSDAVIAHSRQPRTSSRPAARRGSSSSLRASSARRRRTPPRASARRALGLDPTGPVILFFGKVLRVQGRRPAARCGRGAAAVGRSRGARRRAVPRRRPAHGPRGARGRGPGSGCAPGSRSSRTPSWPSYLRRRGPRGVPVPVGDQQQLRRHRPGRGPPRDHAAPRDARRPPGRRDACATSPGCRAWSTR